MPSSAVFLDRDDTLIANASLPPGAFAARRKGDLANPGFVRLLPDVLDACVGLRRAGFELVVVSNQGVVARGGATIAQVEATNARLCELLPDPDRPGTSLIERVYFCPYHPGGNVSPYNTEHPWRKPGPGMLFTALNELGLDPALSWLVGDADRDVEAGLAAGLGGERTLRIGPGADFADLAAAAAHILSNR
jgi:D-glycero-D-manno-heptose 1,7-bisphosphate phosphatase